MVKVFLILTSILKAMHTCRKHRVDHTVIIERQLRLLYIKKHITKLETHLTTIKVKPDVPQGAVFGDHKENI